MVFSFGRRFGVASAPAPGCLVAASGGSAANLRCHHQPSLRSTHLKFTYLPPSFCLWTFGRAVSIPFFTIYLGLYLPVSASLTPIVQMLSQRILARRMPQVAARYAIAPRAAFSQASTLRAAEVEDPLQVRSCLTMELSFSPSYDTVLMA